MNNDRNAFKAGLFIVISIALIVFVIVGVKGLTRLIEPNQTRVATFKLTDDVGGLRVGDDVRVGGLKVGVVRDLDLRQATTPLIVVSFQLPKRIVLREGATVQVQGTLTGSSWLNIDNLGAGNAIPENVALVGAPSGYTQIFSALGEAAPQVKALVADVRTGTLPKVNDALVTFKGTGERASEAMVQARDLLGESKTDLKGTLANLNTATGDIKTKLPAILERVDSALAKVNTSLDSAKGAIHDLKATMANAKDLTASARGIVVTNRGKIDNIASSLKTASDNLKFATAEVRRSPWRLLYQPSKGEVANLNLYDAARQFAEGANDMSDAATSLRDALRDPRVEPAQIQKLVEKLDQSFTGFKKVEDGLWKQVQPE